MKKQFNRMKQLANQTVGRAEKTEVLNDDLLQIERRMEAVRAISHNAHKRLVACLQGQLGTDAEKRYRKLPLTALSQTIQDGGSQLGEESLIGKLMEACGEAENKLAGELMQYELQIEKDVLEPLSQLAEVDIPNIQKQRKQLAKLVLDYDSAKARCVQATKSTNTQMLTAKVDSLREEMDEAKNKYELCKDQLSADMYNFSSKEGNYSCFYVMLLEAQAEYHRRSLSVLESIMPTIYAQQDCWTEKPAFGTSLDEHLKRSSREIALPMEACVMMLLETGMKEEGIFRIAAGASKLKKLKAALDCSTSQLEEFYSDPHAVAGALKSYLRELPEPLMTFQLYDDWIQASSVSDPDKRLQALWVTCDNLPKNHKANFKYLIKFLARLVQDSDVNKMTPSNIAIVLGPNLLWMKSEGSLAEMAATTSVHVVSIIESIIQHAVWFFPEDVDFNVSGVFAMPTNHINHATMPDPDSATLERKRPGSLVGTEGDVSRKDSSANKLLEPPTPRRSNTLSRKQHVSPSFQPPLPPVEAGEAEPQPVTQGLEAGPIAMAMSQQLVGPVGTEENGFSKSRELPTTPPPQKNGTSGLQVMPTCSALGPGQLIVGTPQACATGPSPHIVRRGTKKPAPAPPKPTNPPPGQPSSQAHSSGMMQPQVSIQKPPSGPFPAGQNIPQLSSGLRRHSSSQSFQAPNHPPPQPPNQAVSPPKAKPAPDHGIDHSPPSSPTPPDTPPPFDSSLARPRPVPRPRIRPNMPPPPNPTNDGANDVCGPNPRIG